MFYPLKPHVSTKLPLPSFVILILVWYCGIVVPRPTKYFCAVVPGVDPLLEAQAADAAPHGRLVDRPGVARHRHLDRPEVTNHRPEIKMVGNVI